MRALLAMALIAAVVALLPVSTGFAAKDEPVAKPEPLILTEADAAKAVNAVVGQRIVVRLEGDRKQTGWEASAVEGAVMRQGAMPGEKGVPAECEFTPAPNSQHPEAGTYAFSYIANAPGRAELRFVYVYPGGPHPVPRSATKLVRQVRITVDVSK